MCLPGIVRLLLAGQRRSAALHIASLGCCWVGPSYSRYLGKDQQSGVARSRLVGYAGCYRQFQDRTRSRRRHRCEERWQIAVVDQLTDVAVMVGVHTKVTLIEVLLTP